MRIGTVEEEKDRAERARQEVSSSGHPTPKCILARTAHETLQIVASGSYTAPDSCKRVNISELVTHAVASSVHYAADTWRPSEASYLPAIGSRNPICEVWECSVLVAAEELAREALSEGLPPPGVLNFASARNPGGGFTTGAKAQEECIARSSALYPCLSKHFDAFFVPSRRAKAGAYTHNIIYSPRVPVIRSDSGSLLAVPYTADFATAAAPNLGCIHRDLGRVPIKQAYRVAEGLLRERIYRVLDTFLRHGAKDLVLGAWGCGVFGNDPDTVAALFEEELRGRFCGCFRHVVFAVLDWKMAATFGAKFSTEVVDPKKRLKTTQVTSRGSQSKAGASAAGSPRSVVKASEDNVTASALTKDAKAFFKAAKKAREILKLEEVSATGKALDKMQEKKLERKHVLFSELSALEKQLPSDSELRSKNEDLLAAMAAYFQA